MSANPNSPWKWYQYLLSLSMPMGILIRKEGNPMNIFHKYVNILFI
jgi:hypothetical protein